MPNRERSSCIPCLAIVRECATERSGGDRARFVANRRAGAASCKFGCTFWCSSARAESMQMSTAGHQQSASHHGFFGANRHVRCTAIRTSKITCLICRRSRGAARGSDAHELCTAGGSAFLYCTVSKRGYRPVQSRGDSATIRVAQLVRNHRDSDVLRCTSRSRAADG